MKRNDARLVSMLEVLLHQYYIFDLRSFIACLRADGKLRMADWLSDQVASSFEWPAVEASATANVGTQSVEDFVEVEVAEAIVCQPYV